MLRWVKKYGILLLIFGLCIFIGLLFYMHDQSRVHMKQESFRFEYGTKIPYTSDAYFDYQDSYETVTFDEKLFAMKEVGSYEVKVTFAQQEYTLPIEIVDESAPVITISNDEALIYRFQNKLFGSFYKITDNSAATGEIRLNKQENGQQEVCILATDAYENKAKECKMMQVEIKDLQLAQIPKVNSAEELINAFIREKQLNTNSFAFFYESFYDQEVYLYNSDCVINAASTIKVPLNMLYEDAYAKKEMDPNQTVSLLYSDIEPGGGMTSEHKLNTSLTYAYLQEQSIVYSDNTATNMLVRALGGFSVFRKQIAQYSKAQLPESFYSQNVITAAYMSDVMHTLYQQSDRYHHLIEHMKQASEGEYLQAGSDAFEIAQKYGSFDDVLHAVGIVYTPKPYAVGIFTMNREDGEAIIKELNEWLIAYQFQK